MYKQTSITALLLTMALVTGALGINIVHKNSESSKGANQQQLNAPDSPGKTGVPLKPVQSGLDAPTVVRVYGARWEIGKGRFTAIILRNQNKEAAIANVILFSADGSQEQTTQAKVAPHSMSRLDLADLVTADPDSLHWGGLLVQSNEDISGELLMENVDTGNSFSQHLQGGYRFDTENALFAPWWLAGSASDGNLTVFNASEQAITVTPFFAAAGQPDQAGSAFDLNAHASAKFSLRSLMETKNLSGNATGLITLRYTGPAHALQPSLQIVDRSSGFLLPVPFNARHNQLMAGATHWQFPYVPLSAALPAGQHGSEPLTTRILLSNGTESPLAPELTASFAAGKNQGTRKVALSLPPLSPHEARLVDLSQFVDAGVIPANVSRLALMAGNNGSPGDLGITVFSVGQTSERVQLSSGLVLPSDVVDSSFWDIGVRTALPQIKNNTDAHVNVRATVYFPTSHGVGSYLLPLMDVAPHGMHPVGLRQVISSGSTDENGSQIPVGTVAGAITLRVVNATGQLSAPDSSSPECEKECALFEEQAPGIARPQLVPGNVSSMLAEQQAPVGNPAGINGGVQTTQAARPNSGVFFANDACAPTIDGISPNSGFLGRNAGVTITGSDFDESDLINIDGGMSGTVIQVSTDGTSITAEFDIPSGAATGNHNVTVSNFNGDSNSATFSVSKPLPPVLESLDPNVGGPGNNNLQVRIDGRFLAGDTITVTGGITAVPTNPTDGQVMTATFSIPQCATGQQQVTISDWLGQTSGTLPFTVNDPPAATIAAISPTTWPAGQPTKVTITGTNLTCSPQVQSSDGLITFDTPVHPDETGQTITVNATVDPNDPGGEVEVFVATGGATPNSSPVQKLALGGQTTVTSGGRSLSTPGSSKGSSSKQAQVGSGKSSGGSVGPSSVKTLTQSSTATKATSIGPRPALVSNDLLVLVQPIDAPIPQIIFLGNNIANNVGTNPPTNNPQNVYIGQQIKLTAKISVPQNVQITSESWSTPTNSSPLGSLPDGIAIAGYNDHQTIVSRPVSQPSPAGGFADSLQPTVCQTGLTCDYNVFYWVDQADSRALTFTYQLANGKQASATATFNVRGPTNPNISSTTGQQNFVPTNVTPTIQVYKMQLVGPGNAFTLSATPPIPANAGSYSFVQLISADTSVIVDSAGSQSCTSKHTTNGPGLDTLFPYPSNVAALNTTRDSPSVDLNLSTDSSGNSIYSGEVIRNFAAKMYLMWDPTLMDNGQSGCQAQTETFDATGAFTHTDGTCTGSIPVPLGFVHWSFSGDGINTKYGTPNTHSEQFVPGPTTFVFGCRNNTINPGFTQSSEIPTWTQSFILGENYFTGHSCH